VAVFGMMHAVAIFMQRLHFVDNINDPEYHALRRKGWHPFWSILPSTVNNDSIAVKAGRT
jgi:hypothetical protein